MKWPKLPEQLLEVAAAAASPMVVEQAGSFTLEQANQQFASFSKDEPELSGAFSNASWEEGIDIFTRELPGWIFVASPFGYSVTVLNG